MNPTEQSHAQPTDAQETQLSWPRYLHVLVFLAVFLGVIAVALLVVGGAKDRGSLNNVEEVSQKYSSGVETLVERDSAPTRNDFEEVFEASATTEPFAGRGTYSLNSLGWTVVAPGGEDFVTCVDFTRYRSGSKEVRNSYAGWLDSTVGETRTEKKSRCGETPADYASAVAAAKG